MSLSIGIGTGSFTVSLSAAGAVAENSRGDVVTATIDGSSVTTSGPVAVTADAGIELPGNAPTFSATAVAASVAVSGAPSGVSVNVTVGVAIGRNTNSMSAAGDDHRRRQRVHRLRAPVAAAAASPGR